MAPCDRLSSSTPRGLATAPLSFGHDAIGFGVNAARPEVQAGRRAVAGSKLLSAQLRSHSRLHKQQVDAVVRFRRL